MAGVLGRGRDSAARCSDAEAKWLATSALQRHLKLIRHEPVFIPPPVASMKGIWTEAERFLVEYRLGVGVVGGPKIVEQKLGALLDETRADELIFTSDLYEHALGLRSFGLAAGG